MNCPEMTLLKISNEADRITVASVLYKNGYTVAPIRKKKPSGSSYEYYVGYSCDGSTKKTGVADNGS